MSDRSRLVKMKIQNIGSIGPEGLTVSLDNILCLVGPNNSGKSTVLRGYQLATGKATFADGDLCKRALDQPASVELSVHIPTGTPNIAEKWIQTEDGLRIVKSRWEWRRELAWKPVRTTWDPEASGWASDGKAAGLDEVFSSRLPVALRVGTLQDPEEEHRALLALVLQPITDRLRSLQRDNESDLKRALDSFVSSVEKPLAEERSKVASIRDDLNRYQTQIFPNLAIDLDIDIGKLEFDLSKQLNQNSGVRFTEWSDEVRWNQQGTGSQRALFWALLQVRSRLQTATDLRVGREKAVVELQRKVARLEKEKATVKRADTISAKEEEIERLRQEIDGLRASPTSDNNASDAGGVQLPGYMLLIDEPEVGLHPSAVRAASRYLYSLADDPAWQIILTSHHPAFIDPLQDHTTIVRLCRNNVCPTPNTYRAEEAGFSKDERSNLKILNRFDATVAEMFFGQYPLLIEGDTEYACFEWLMNRREIDWPMQQRPLLVRARGKSTLILLIRMLEHFQVPFSVLHDADYPRNKDGSRNAAWTVNEQIHGAITRAREKGIRIVHRVSLPTFEFQFLPVSIDVDGNVVLPDDKEKPWNALAKLATLPEASESVHSRLKELTCVGSREEPFENEFKSGLTQGLANWVSEHSVRDARFQNAET